MTQYVSIQEASKIVGLSVISLRRGVKSGRFPAIRVGNTPKGKLMFDLTDLVLVLATEAQSAMQLNSKKDGE